MEANLEQINEVTVMPDDRVMVEVLKYFTTPEEIEALEGELLKTNTLNIQVKHFFWKGGYARKITIPKGTLAIGHAHSDECLNIVVSGSVSVLIEGEVKVIRAGATFVSAPGERKIGYCHEDCTWITTHATSETSIDKIEASTIIKSKTFREHEKNMGIVSTEYANCPKDEFWEDRLDYFKAIAELGFTHEEVRASSENTSDQVEFAPGKGDAIYVASSPIQGNGVFSAFDVPAGIILCPARIAGKRTKAGRYTNHSRHPNCHFVLDSNGDIFLKTLTSVSEGQELTCNYRDAKKTGEEADFLIKLNTQ